MPNRLAICRLSEHAAIPAWAANGPFFSITRTDDELSIVCEEDKVPQGTKAEKNWRAFKLIGPYDLSLTGVLVSFAKPLADAEISIFAISTYDTDYVLVKDDQLEQAAQVLAKFCNIRR